MSAVINTLKLTGRPTKETFYAAGQLTTRCCCGFAEKPLTYLLHPLWKMIQGLMRKMLPISNSFLS